MTDLEDIPLSEMLSRLYRAEINAGVSSFWDAGYRAWIGDDSNGIKAEQTFSVGKGPNDYATWDDLWQAVSVFLWEAAENLYPGWDTDRQSDETFDALVET